MHFFTHVIHQTGALVPGEVFFTDQDFLDGIFLDLLLQCVYIINALVRFLFIDLRFLQ